MDIIGFKMASPGNKGTIFYVVLIALTIATSIIIQIYYAQSIHVAAWSVGCGEGEYRAACLATTSVLRFSFALVCFLCFEMICTFMNAKYYDSLLPFREVLYIGTLIGFMYISSEVMLGYAWVIFIVRATLRMRLSR